MVVITEEEKKLSYAKYFYRDIAMIPEDKMVIAKEVLQIVRNFCLLRSGIDFWLE